MELGKHFQNGLSLAGNSAKVSDDMFTKLVNYVFLATLDTKVKELEVEPSVPGTVKLAFAGMIAFVYEAAKYDADPSTLSSVLEDCGFNADRITQFLNKYQQEKLRIRTKLSKTGHQMPYIVDVDWRQDYLIKCNTLDKICQPSYLLTLKTEGKYDNQDITFSCSLEQLQDLVGKLKDATKCLERNAHS